MRIFEREGILYDKLSENRVRCNVCPKHCIIKPSETGFCNAHRNVDGELITYFGVLAAATPGYIDLSMFHFQPSKRFLRVYAPFCNFRCSFCGEKSLSFMRELAKVVEYDLPNFSSFCNLEESQDRYKTLIWEGDPKFYYISPRNCCKIAIKSNCIGVLYYAAEPTINMEWVLETAKEVHKRNGLNAMETNGYLTTEAADLLAPHLDAVIIGLKNCGSTSAYQREISVSDLTPIYETMKTFRNEGVHVEICSTITLKSRAELHSNFRKLGKWVCENLGDETPILLATDDYQKFDSSFLLGLLPIAEEIGLKYFYPIVAEKSSVPTYCPRCGTEVVSRTFIPPIKISVYVNLNDGHCPECGEKIPIVYEG